MATITLTVIGRPQPAGSKRAIPIYKGKRGQNRRFTGRVAVVEDAARSKPWQAQVTAAAIERLHDHGQVTGPIDLEVDFYVKRPRTHYGSGRNHDQLKPSAPIHPTIRPDVTKLLRAVEDAITASGLWVDDAQVVTQTARKRYGAPERAEITIHRVDGPPAVSRETISLEHLFA